MKAQTLCILFLVSPRFANAHHAFFLLLALPKPLVPGNKRYRARVAYDGAGFQGFQVQPNCRTIQGELEEVLSKRFNRTMRVVGASRTDAGVHARGQAIHFDLTEGDMRTVDEPKKLEKSLNKMLRQDLRIWNIQEAPTVIKDFTTRVQEVEWNAIIDSKKKLYVYRMSIGNQMDPLDRHTRFQVPWPNTDIEVLRRCLNRFEGRHDFRAFACGMERLEKNLSGTMDTCRDVYSIDLIDEGHGLYRIEVVLKGALYKMIRNMVGTALYVAIGRFDECKFVKLIEQENGEFTRYNNPCRPAPPNGLTLERVYYEDY